MAVVYRAGVLGMRSVGGGHGANELARRFVHSLVPIALAYAVAQNGPAEPDQDQHHGQEIGHLHEPVPGVGEHRRHGALAFQSSHRASMVKATITTSTQYCDRTARRASL